jgi:DNA-binding beta-propeller fold protein YncE
MPLEMTEIIAIPHSSDSAFDHGAFEPNTRRVFVAHTARNCIEVIDHDSRRHLATLDSFPAPAGVVADGGQVLITNRGSAELAWVDARTLKTLKIFDTGTKPNGVAFVPELSLAIVACIGDDSHDPKLEVLDLESQQRWAIGLPGQPRWCVTDTEGRYVFLAIREPSMILVAALPTLDGVRHYALPTRDAHGLDIDRSANLLYIACDEGALLELDIGSGEVRRSWPLKGGPDATFFDATTGVVHVAIAKPGLVQSINPRTGNVVQFATGLGAKTTALVSPGILYVFSAAHGGALVLAQS